MDSDGRHGTQKHTNPVWLLVILDFIGLYWTCYWYRRWGSNPHAREGRGILSPVRLPVPPLRPGKPSEYESYVTPEALQSQSPIKPEALERRPCACRKSSGETMIYSGVSLFQLVYPDE